MYNFKTIVTSLGLAAGLLAASSSAIAARVVLTENFDGPGIPATFVVVNNSTGAGSVGTSPGWFQGNPAVFTAQAGAANSYISANFATATPGGNIRDWLLLPAQTYYAGDILSFFSRTEIGGGPFNDRLQVRYSTNGASTTIADFLANSILLDINGALNGSYPESWAQFLVTLPAFTGRLAFFYNVTDTNLNGDVVGIDTLAITSSVPEPATPLTMALGFGALALVLRRRSKQN